MNTLKTALVAMTALVGASAQALAYSEAGVTQLDVARVSGQIQQIQNDTLRAQAQGLVSQAQGFVQDENHGHAAFALDQARALAASSQTAAPQTAAR